LFWVFKKLKEKERKNEKTERIRRNINYSCCFSFCFVCKAKSNINNLKIMEQILFGDCYEFQLVIYG